MYSKSIFGYGRSMCGPSVINPVGCGYGNGYTNFIITDEVLNALKEIQHDYTLPMSTENYSAIPTDYNRYLRLYGILDSTIPKVVNGELKLLLLIAQEGLTGAVKSYGLNYNNIELSLQNALLRQTIDDILSNKNVVPAISSTRGQFTINKSFTLAPLFSYYILLYGMPAYGEGFDESKLAVLLSVLEKNCINPYY
jgi:hypothetical protein